jgi:lipid A 3-O-deacylase
MKFKFPLLLFCFFCSVSAFAQTYTTEFGIQTDNDSYLGQGSDRYYTDGIYFYYRKALKIPESKTATLENKVLGFEFGQKIYNPYSGYVPSAQYVDRPFAGYLYAGTTLNLLYKDESSIKLSAQLGVVGPASAAKGVQTWVHKTFGFYAPAGWQYQIKNDPEINLGAEYNKLIASAPWIDVSLASYVNLGNGFTGAGLGPMLRIGAFNQLFHSVATQSTAIQSNSIDPLHKNEFFFYYKPQINYVAYDATIQGGLLESHGDPNSQEITLDKEPFIFSNKLGLAFTTRRFTFDIAAIFHTQEVKEMFLSEQWGTVTGVYRFR